MKTKSAVIAVGVLFAGICRAGNAVNPDAVELSPIPRPVRMTCDIDRPVAFDASTRVTVECPSSAAVDWLARHFGEWFGADAPQVVAGTASGDQAGRMSLPAGDEAYAVKADADGVRSAARTLAGVRWAAYTIRPLAVAKRGTFVTKGRELPTLDVSDAPHLAFRAIHICWLPELRPAQIERAIRLAAMMKFNYAIIESWGTFRSEKNPWWGLPDGPMTLAETRRLAALGRDLGITLIPQVNAFGHASLSRATTYKHVVLDLKPHYEPLYEPGGWNWCLSNPETQRVLRELIAEIHDAFGNPPYFHLGCDEAQPPACSECRKRPYGQLVCEHISGLADFVRSRGARPMIWHDMLIKRGAPEWDKFEAKGTDATITLVDTLPKDVVICDWEYSYCDMAEVRADWPTMAYFKNKGFSVAGCPWMNFNTMRPMADYLAQHGCFGFIETTWHHLFHEDGRRMFVWGSSAAWGADVPKQAPQQDVSFMIMLRLVGQDMKVADPRDTGTVDHQIPSIRWIDN